MKSAIEETLALHIRVNKLPAPEREHRFHDTRMWRFDFAWPALKLAAECEGGIYSRGRHTRGSGFETDCEKYAEALLLGWRVFRLTAKMVEDGRAIQLLKRALAAAQCELLAGANRNAGA